MCVCGLRLVTWLNYVFLSLRAGEEAKGWRGEAWSARKWKGQAPKWHLRHEVIRRQFSTAYQNEWRPHSERKVHNEMKCHKQRCSQTYSNSLMAYCHLRSPQSGFLQCQYLMRVCQQCTKPVHRPGLSVLHFQSKTVWICPLQWSYSLFECHRSHLVRDSSPPPSHLPGGWKSYRPNSQRRRSGLPVLRSNNSRKLPRRSRSWRGPETSIRAS